MLFDDDPRDIRKKEFIERMRRRKSGELLRPLSEKIAAWEKGEIDSSEVFKAAGYAGRKGDAMIADFKKRPDVILAGITMDENRYITSLGDIGVEVRLSDITEVFCDALVTPVEPDGTCCLISECYREMAAFFAWKRPGFLELLFLVLPFPAAEAVRLSSIANRLTPHFLPLQVRHR